MAHVILGFLILTNQSLYDLIKSFQSGVSLFYSASSGSIKRALDGLLANGLIEIASVEDGARGKKIYRVTEAGRRDFHRWMTADLTLANAESEMLSRLYFMGLVDPSRHDQVLGPIVVRLKAELAQLSSLHERLARQEIPERFQEVVDHQRRTLDYGIASHRFTLDWLHDQYGERGALED